MDKKKKTQKNKLDNQYKKKEEPEKKKKTARCRSGMSRPFVEQIHREETCSSLRP